MIVLIDNYDSFTYNIHHYVQHFMDNVIVIRNTEKIEVVKNLRNLDAIILSPGPSHPENSALTLDTLDVFLGKVPIFGVCLGMQAIGYYFGSNIRKAKKIMHGKVDRIEHKTSPIFKSLKPIFNVVRYHSLVVDNIQNLDTSAMSLSDNEIMAIENTTLNVFGVQFHPESFLTDNGIEIIKNFLEVVYD